MDKMPWNVSNIFECIGNKEYVAKGDMHMANVVKETNKIELELWFFQLLT
jgi:hypothetical protein